MLYNRRHANNSNKNNSKRIPCIIQQRHSPSILQSILIFVVVLLSQTTLTYAGLTIGSVSSTSTCYDALSSSSGDDNHVDKTEYVTFINILSEDYFTYPQFDTASNEYANLPVSEFYQLPIELQTNFNKLACGGEFISCAEAYLVTDGAGDGETPTDQQTIYLYEVCTNTEKNIDDAKATLEENEGLTLAPVTSAPVGSPTIPPSSASSALSTSATTAVDLSKAVTYNTTFQYQILVSTGMTAQAVMDPMHQMNMDLVKGMDEWSAVTCEEWNTNQTSARRRLRGRGGVERSRVLLVSTEPESSIITNVTDAVCNNSTETNNSTRTLQWITGDHCLEITQYQTYYLLLENYPEDVATFVASEFEKYVANGSYLNTIPEPSRSEIRTIFPVSNGDKTEVESNSPAAALKPTEPPPSPVIESPDDSGGSNTGAIAGGVTVALLVAIVGLFVARRRMVADELKDDELDSADEDEDKKNSEWSDDDSSSSGSSRSSSSSGSSSSSSGSGNSTSGSSNSYYSNSGSTSGTGTSTTGGGNGPQSVSASDNDSSSASTSKEPARAAPAAAKAAFDVLNSADVHDSMDSGSSVGEASLVEEAAIDEIDSDSDDDSQQSDEDHHQDYEMNVDLTDADGLEIPQMGRRSKESSYADDSSAGSSGWNSSVGDSSSTNTESVESFDANMVDVGSSTVSNTNASSDDYDIDEYAIDRELLPGVNPAMNPAIQSGVSMLPVDEMEDDDSDYLSDDSDNSATLTKRNDAAPLGREIQSAIEQGDWSAVGATAAMIAPLPDEGSTSTSVGNTTHTSEMDALLNSGNWSGIVAVAARYADDASIQSGPPPSDHGSITRNRNNSVSSASIETADEPDDMTQSYSGRSSHISNATESEYSASSASYTDDSYTNTSYSGTGTRSSGTGTYTGTYGTGASEELTHPSGDRNSSLTSSRSPPGSSSYVNQSTSSSSDNRDDKQRINAFRAEVEALVRRVVPDEVDNVEAIMIQFSGREEELIATLRGMQEKTIAQRAKAAVQRSAKKERGGRMPDDYTESSEDQSLRDSTFTGSATSANDPMSITSLSHSITEEFADDSSQSGSESGSEYSGSANETEEGSRSEYSHSASEYTSRSEYSQSYTTRSGSGSGGSSMYSESQSTDGYNKSNLGSVLSQDTSNENPDGLDNMMDSGDWHGIVDHAKNMRGQAREDLD